MKSRRFAWLAPPAVLIPLLLAIQALEQPKAKSEVKDLKAQVTELRMRSQEARELRAQVTDLQKRVRNLEARVNEINKPKTYPLGAQ